MSISCLAFWISLYGAMNMNVWLILRCYLFRCFYYNFLLVWCLIKTHFYNRKFQVWVSTLLSLALLLQHHWLMVNQNLNMCSFWRLRLYCINLYVNIFILFYFTHVYCLVLNTKMIVLMWLMVRCFPYNVGKSISPDKDTS